MRYADNMQHWLAESLAGRVECVSHAIFFILRLNAPAVCVCVCVCADVTVRPLPGRVRF